MTNTYNAIVVGAGAIGHAHMEGYNLVDAVEVVAVVDPLEPARQTYMDEYGIPRGYATLTEALKGENPDIVSVCAWHLLHDPMTVEAAEWPSVKGIICEKPMAIGMRRADRMVEACEANDTKLVISHQRRFTPGWEKAKELVEDGAIGEVLRADLRVRDGLANWGTHSIDGARFTTGDPKAQWVMGAVERRTDKYERATVIEDACMGLIHFGPSLQFFIQSDLLDRNSDAGKFLLRGTEGLLHVTETTLKLFNAATAGWTTVPLGLQEGDVAIGGNTNAAQTVELIEWIEGGPEHRGSGRTARDTVEIMMAMYESARHNRVIHLPLEEKEYPLELMINEGKLPVEVEGSYDIRAFLNRDGIDEARYRALRDDGLSHSQAMRTVHDEMEAAR